MDESEDVLYFKVRLVSGLWSQYYAYRAVEHGGTRLHRYAQSFLAFAHALCDFLPTTPFHNVIPAEKLPISPLPGSASARSTSRRSAQNYQLNEKQRRDKAREGKKSG